MARNTATPPPVPARAKSELGVGTLAGLLCAEAMSSVRLYGLGGRVGFAWYLAWLLPAALDVYAITMVRFFSLVSADHPLRRKAAKEAIIALVITVGCNALYETIVEFSRQLPAWMPGTLFVLVSALAPFVAGRLIHFRSEVGNGAGESSADRPASAATATPRPSTTPVHPAPVHPSTTAPAGRPEPSTVHQPTPSTPRPSGPAVNGQQTVRPPVQAAQRPSTDKPAMTGQPSMDVWVDVGRPVYERIATETDKRPGETAFHAALTIRAAALVNTNNLPVAYLNPSLSAAKRVRKEIEDRGLATSPVEPQEAAA